MKARPWLCPKPLTTLEAVTSCYSRLPRIIKKYMRLAARSELTRIIRAPGSLSPIGLRETFGARGLTSEFGWNPPFFSADQLFTILDCNTLIASYAHICTYIPRKVIYRVLTRRVMTILPRRSSNQQPPTTGEYRKRNNERGEYSAGRPAK